jgi:hypothetical protein
MAQTSAQRALFVLFFAAIIRWRAATRSLHQDEHACAKLSSSRTAAMTVMLEA